MSGQPTVIIPYPGPCLDREVQDIVLYLRPETNGVRTESCMLRALREEPASRDLYELAYLANLPGEFIGRRGIVARRYALRERFAREGGSAFTPTMKRLFEQHFAVRFDSAPVVGAYEALERLGMTEEGLFSVWVDERHFAKIHQQSIKLVRGLYVVNYDIPALLHRDNQKTDVFTMILRSFAPYARVHALIDRMCAALEAAGIIAVRRPPSRVFHASTGPFMQILDGTGWVYDASGEPAAVGELSFGAYLLGRDVALATIEGALREPIMRFRTPEGVVERHLFDHTFECSFAEALQRLRGRVD